MIAIQRSDGRSRRQVVVDHLKGLPVDAVVPYKDLSRALGISDVSTVQQVVAKAVGDFEEETSRSLVNERGVGYRIVEGVAQINSARRKQQKGRKVLTKAARTARTTNLAAMTPAEREMAKQVQLQSARLEALTRMTAEKFAIHDTLFQDILATQHVDRSRQRATEAEVADLKRQMDEVADLKRQMDDLVDVREVFDLLRRYQGQS